MCRCRCPCAAPPVEQRVHLLCPHQSCSLTCPGQCPTWPQVHPEEGFAPYVTPCSGTWAVCCWGCCGVVLAVPQQGPSSSPCSKSSTWGLFVIPWLLINQDSLITATSIRYSLSGGFRCPKKPLKWGCCGAHQQGMCSWVSMASCPCVSWTSSQQTLPLFLGAEGSSADTPCFPGMLPLLGRGLISSRGAEQEVSLSAPGPVQGPPS